MRGIFVAMAAALTAFGASARLAPAVADSVAVERPVSAAYTVGVGTSSVTDTYLSPSTFRGAAFTIGYERMQAMKFDPERWVMQLDARIGLSRGENRAGNATTWGIDFDFSWGMMHRWTLTPSLTVAAGGAAHLDAGCYYNTRNSNNPVSAKAALTLDLTGMAAWDGRLGRLPVTVRLQPSMPVVGAFFSPEYDELYYEIYLGNRSGLVHPAWWGNRFAFDTYLSVDLHFGKTSLRVGYRYDVLSSSVSGLKCNVVTNMFVIGLSGNWLSVK